MLGNDTYEVGGRGRPAGGGAMGHAAGQDAAAGEAAVWSVASVDGGSQGSPASSPSSPTGGGAGFAAVGRVGSVRRLQPRSSIRMMPVLGEEGEASDAGAARGDGAVAPKPGSQLWPPRSQSFVNDRHQSQGRGPRRLSGARSFSMGGRGQLGLSPIRGGVPLYGNSRTNTEEYSPRYDGVDAVGDGNGRDSRSTVGSTLSRRSRHSLKPDSPVPWRHQDTAGDAANGGAGGAGELQPESNHKLAALHHQPGAHRRVASNDSLDTWLEAPTPGTSERAQRLQPIRQHGDTSVARRPTGEGSPVSAHPCRTLAMQSSGNLRVLHVHRTGRYCCKR